jgi:uncharacterized protein YndB with AHSA1/START domain
MTTMTTTATTQVFRVWIKATPERIWEAITSPEWTDRYGFGGFPQYDDGLTAGSPFRFTAGTGMQQVGVTGTVVEGEILEVDPPHRLVMSWRLTMDAKLLAEPLTRLTYELAAQDGGVTRLTVTHELDGAPTHLSLVDGSLADTRAGGGWAWVLSDLKSLLETGAPLAG